MEVAMKFISSDFQVKALNEVNTYIALGAWNDTKVQNEKFQCEAYGIPTLYHFGTWKNYYILAITLLDLEFERTRKAGQLTAIDKLIVFREMVSSPFNYYRQICILSYFFFFQFLKGENIKIHSLSRHLSWRSSHEQHDVSYQ